MRGDQDAHAMTVLIAEGREHDRFHRGYSNEYDDEVQDGGSGAVSVGCGLCCGMFTSGLVALQLVFLFEISASDSGMQQSCGTAFWPLLLARFITGALEMCVSAAWKSGYDQMRWAHVATRLAFAIGLTVVLAKLPGGITGCERSLEQAATATHSYALLVCAFIYAVFDWLAFAGGACGAGRASDAG